MTQNAKQFDVALSFAGEDREYVGKVAHMLTKMGIQVFYDKYERVTLWGKDLYVHLMDIYQHKSRYTVIFCSKHYAEKLWAKHELKSAQARAFELSKEYILPARFDNTEIPGILDTTSYVDLNEYTPEEFAELVKEKVGPISREEFFPEELDLLFEAIGDKTKEQKEMTHICAEHFFRAMTLMTPEERWLLARAIICTCPDGPPDNVHQDIEYLGRKVKLTPEEIISRFARLDCLGIEARLEKEPGPPDHLRKVANVLYIEFHPLADNCLDNATFVAIEIINFIFSHYCPEHRKEIIERLDFSVLSTLEGFPDKHEE